MRIRCEWSLHSSSDCKTHTQLKNFHTPSIIQVKNRTNGPHHFEPSREHHLKWHSG
ncbi:hypothetical protein TNIN_161751, partial [Trichonephila inaurata madagascariensis]